MFSVVAHEVNVPGLTATDEKDMPPRSWSGENTGSEKLERGPTAHRSLEDSDPLHVAFDDAGASGVGESGSDGVEVLRDHPRRCRGAAG